MGSIVFCIVVVVADWRGTKAATGLAGRTLLLVLLALLLSRTLIAIAQRGCLLLITNAHLRNVPILLAVVAEEI